MRRAPIVLAGTVAGLAGVLTFHTTPTKLGLAGAAARTGGGPAGSGSGAPAAANPAPSQHGQAANGGSGAGGGAGASPTRASQGSQPGGTRTATGAPVNYFYGVLSVKVTISGHKIVKVGIASLNDGGNPRSQFIDQQSIPMLEQQTMQAQSARIQGVSGASYTSAGFDRSLQSALHALGLQ